MSETIIDSSVIEAEETPVVAKYIFDAEFQDKIAALVLRDTSFMQRTDGLVRPEYFENPAQAIAVNLALRYFAKFKKVPADMPIYGNLIREDVLNKVLSNELAAVAAIQIKRLFEADVSDRDYVIEQVSTFARHQAVAEAFIKAYAKLASKDFEKIEKLMKAALDVGAHMDNEGYDYGKEIESRTFERLERARGVLPPTGITTGYAVFDDALYHKGWGRKELSVIMGGAKAGKTTALIGFGVNAMGAGSNVLYVTLEVGKDIIAKRIDANISDRAMMELEASVHDVRTQVKAFIEGTRKPKFPGEVIPKAGKFLVHEFPTGSMTVTDLRRLIERYKGKGIIFDLVIVDYGDLMAPERYTDNVQENSKSVYVNLRGLAMAEGFAVLTATQTNRIGGTAAVAKMEHVSEDFNKIRIADIVISINRTDEERASNQARLFLAASRNQPGHFSIRVEQELDRMRFISKVLGIE